MPLILLRSASALYVQTTDPYPSNVVLLMHMDGTNGSTNYIDQTGKSVSQSRTSMNTSTKKFGTSSAYLSSSANQITVANDGWSFNLGTLDFTIEMWVNPTSFNATDTVICLGRSNTAGSLAIRLDSSGVPSVYIGGTLVLTSVSSIHTGGWTFLALVSHNNVLTLYLSGQAVGTVSNSTSLSSTQSLMIGYDDSIGSGSEFYGYLDDVRITNGVCRYTTNFLPPLAAFPNSTLWAFDINFRGVWSLLHFENGIADTSNSNGTSWSSVGPAVSSTKSAIDTQSLFFNGTNNTNNRIYSNSSIPALTTGDFTAEMWINLSVLAANIYLLSGTSNNNPGVYLSSTASVLSVNLYGILSTFAIGSTLSINTWYHVAVCRASGTLRAFINGGQIGSSVANAGSLVSMPLQLGCSYTGASPFNGYIDEFRYTVTARYIQNFTTQSAAYPDQSDMYPDVPPLPMADTNGNLSYSYGSYGYSVSSRYSNGTLYSAGAPFAVSTTYGNAICGNDWSSTNGKQLNEWIKISLPSRMAITGYRLAQSIGGHIYGNFHWSFQGSNDDSNWTTLHTVDNSSLVVGGTSGQSAVNQCVQYNLSAVATYSYFRWITLVSGGTQPAGGYTLCGYSMLALVHNGAADGQTISMSLYQ